MWALTGIYLVIIIYPLFEEWRHRRSSRDALLRMRRHVSLGHRWDPVRGGWVDD